MKEILVSFNNTYQSPGYPSLGLFHIETGNMQIIELPPEIPLTGFLGLAISKDYVFAGLQYSFDATKAYRTPSNIGMQYSEDGTLESLHPCSLLIFDRKSFRLLNQYMFQLVKDVHSFLLNKDESKLYVVSTGTDEIIEIELVSGKVVSEKVIWRPEPGGERADLHHLNSICEWNGDMIVSGFGKKEIPDDWNSAKNGFIYNISKSTFLIRGIQQPHSLAVIEDKLAYCESKEKRVRFLGNNDTIEVGGYSRGLCYLENKLFIGTSARRQKSKSTGKVNKISEDEAVGCAITVVSLDTHAENKIIDLNTIGHEIYELLPVDETQAWLLISPRDYRAQFQDAWNEQRRCAIEEINNNISKDSVLIVVDDNSLGIEKENFLHRDVLSFIEKDGIYWGPPAGDDEAIDTIKATLKANKPLTIAFLWPSFWWFDTYPGLNEYLKSHFKNVFKNERLNIFASEK